MVKEEIDYIEIYNYWSDIFSGLTPLENGSYYNTLNYYNPKLLKHPISLIKKAIEMHVLYNAFGSQRNLSSNNLTFEKYVDALEVSYMQLANFTETVEIEEKSQSQAIRELDIKNLTSGTSEDTEKLLHGFDNLPDNQNLDQEVTYRMQKFSAQFKKNTKEYIDTYHSYKKAKEDLKEEELKKSEEPINKSFFDYCVQFIKFVPTLCFFSFLYGCVFSLVLGMITTAIDFFFSSSFNNIIFTFIFNSYPIKFSFVINAIISGIALMIIGSIITSENIIKEIWDDLG